MDSVLMGLQGLKMGKILTLHPKVTLLFRGKKIITKICAGNKKTKNPKYGEREEDDSWCRIKKVLT